MSLCLPEQLSCIQKIKETDLNNFDCPEACNGLFADVRIEKDELLDQSADFKSIVDEYVKYKKNFKDPSQPFNGTHCNIAFMIEDFIKSENGKRFMKLVRKRTCMFFLMLSSSKVPSLMAAKDMDETLSILRYWQEK